MLRRVFVVAVATLSLLVPQMAHADGFGWAQWRESTYAVKHPAPTAPAIDDHLGLGAQKIWGEYDRARDRWLHRAWVAWSEHKEAVERAAAATPAPSTAPPVTYSGSCHGMIAQAFGSKGLSVSYAIAIAERESGCSASAYNPIGLPYGHASGVFQILAPGIWEIWDGRCGFEGSSVFNAYANINVASCMVASGGWGPWAL